MTYGIQIRDPATGELSFNTDDRMLRIVDSFIIDSKSGSRNYPGLSGRGFFLTQWMYGKNAGHGGSEQPPFTAQSIWMDGDNIKWDYNFDKSYNMWFDDYVRSRINVTVVMYK